MSEIINDIPILALREIVVFPNLEIPLYVGREKSIISLNAAVESGDNKLVLVTQKDAAKDHPQREDIYDYGVIAEISQILKLPDGTVKVLVKSLQRVKILDLREEDYLKCDAELLTEEMSNDINYQAYIRSLLPQFEHYSQLNKKVSPELLVKLRDLNNPSELVDVIASNLSIKTEQKQEILECLNLVKRYELILSIIENEINLILTEKRILKRVKSQIDNSQKNYFLNEQLKAIQKELGENDEFKNEITALENQVEKTKLSVEAKEKCEKELKKLRTMNAMSAEATIIRNYIDTIISLPWQKYSKQKQDLNKSIKILDDEHYGMEKVKDRVIEYLAVLQRTKEIKGPILCLVGPPGVGKTSLAKSIADATGRPYVKISLGGVKDEAEIRGHRKTYIGAMPGKIITAMKKAKYSNPVILLDEIDKISSDYRGDPSSALLEVLDPEQNDKFVDHFLEVEYDLSKVMFIATANSLNIPYPLLDRMEIIRLSGYTPEEKLQIAKGHLIPKLRKEHALTEEEWVISDKAIENLIEGYTKEAGVRSLNREISNVARKVVRKLMTEEKPSVHITNKNLEKFAGVNKYSPNIAEKQDLIGITNGLAYSEVGGSILKIETVLVPGKGNIHTTGKLGDVMKESAQAAWSYIKYKAEEFNIDTSLFSSKDLHLHVPEGATPKDGPSAGIAIFTSILSSLTNIPVNHNIAMTGEITLRGRVLPIGGLKEKLLAASNGGIEIVLIPEQNKKDVTEIPENITKRLNIIYVTMVSDVVTSVFGENFLNKNIKK